VSDTIMTSTLEPLELRVTANEKALVRGIARAVKEHLRDQLAPLIQRIEALEQRPALKDAGVWRADGVYDIGAVVTDHGSAWVCKLHHCQSRPGGDGGVGWRLLVKRGRDGKDAGS
jgi:hypothetical protein